MNTKGYDMKKILTALTLGLLLLSCKSPINSSVVSNTSIILSENSDSTGPIQYYDLTFTVPIPEALPNGVVVYVAGNYIDQPSIILLKMQLLTPTQWQLRVNKAEGIYSYKYAFGPETPTYNADMKRTVIIEM
jgi:hypothetical protein